MLRIVTTEDHVLGNGKVFTALSEPRSMVLNLVFVVKGKDNDDVLGEI